MKKLEKLVLNDFPHICVEDQKTMLGGSGPDGWKFMLAPDGVWYAYPGADVYVYGSAPGYITDLANLQNSQQILENQSNNLQSGSYWLSGIGVAFSNRAALGGGLALSVASDNREDDAGAFQNAINALEGMGYTDSSTVRYSHSNGMVQIWDAESGDLLYSYEY